MRKLLLTTALAGVWTASLPAAQQSSTRAKALSEMSDSLAAITERLARAVVLVTSGAYDPPAEAGEGPTVAFRQRAGSGVILSADGYLVTNAHVAVGARSLRVQLPPDKAPPGKSIVRPKGRTFPAELIGADLETDIALLKINASGLPFLMLADSDQVRQGQFVLALGSPMGLDSSVIR
jgi:S1-C subfamily serine protease